MFGRSLKIFEDLWRSLKIFETRSNFRFTMFHTALALASVRRWLCYETRSAWPQQARRRLANWGAWGGPVQTVIPCPEKWSLDVACPWIQGSWMHPKLHGQRCLPHLEDAIDRQNSPVPSQPFKSDRHGLMTTTLSGVLMCSFHHGQRWNWIIARRFIQRKAQESHSSHVDVWCTHSNWHEW